jgi:hypothetical protein
MFEGAMTGVPRAPLRLWPNGVVALLACALVAVTAIAVVAGYWAEEYREQLAGIPCPKGCLISTPPRNVLTVVQLGKGELVNGTYLYSFLLDPEPPPAINASSVFMGVYNSSTAIYNGTADASLNPENVTLDYPNGTPLAFYSPSGADWSTASTRAVSEVCVLTVSSDIDLSGEWLGYWTYEYGRVVGILIA